MGPATGTFAVARTQRAGQHAGQAPDVSGEVLDRGAERGHALADNLWCLDRAGVGWRACAGAMVRASARTEGGMESVSWASSVSSCLVKVCTGGRAARKGSTRWNAWQAWAWIAVIARSLLGCTHSEPNRCDARERG